MLTGLKLKFGKIIVVLFVMWIGLGAYINFYRYESIAVEDVKKSARLTATALAVAVAPYMQTSDMAGLEGAVATLAGDKDIAFIKVQDASGNVMKEAGTSGSKGLISVTMPVVSAGTGIGTVTVGISSVNHQKTMKSYFIWQALAVMLLGLVSIFVLINSFNRLVLKPLEKMNGILKEMAQGGGDLTQRLDVNSTDEIGELAGNFNTFLVRLRDLVEGAQQSAFRVLSLTGRIGEKSRDFLSSSQEQASSTNENFRVLERLDRSVQDIAGSADSLSITATDSSATVTQMAAQVEVVADNTMELSSYVEEASSSLAEMTASIKSVAEDVQVLAELTSETSDSISQIEVSIDEVEERSKEAARLSQVVSEDADTLGNQAIARTIEGMERIRETVEETSEVIERLGASSVEIGHIVKVIDEVANQTSLLALNAAILAAQAGEHGKGFAVVADEIKELAEKTSSSTGEIKKLIKSVQRESKEAVEAMRAGRERVLEGAQMAYGASDALKKILVSSERSRETAGDIERATTQQVASVRKVSEAIKNVHERIRSIERATMEQSKGSELISSAAEKMNDIAKEVRRALSEQSRGIKDFARSLDDTKEVVGTIANATRSQSDESSVFVQSMEKFLDIAQKNTEVSTGLEGAVEELLRQAESLRDEMGRFKI